MLQERKEEEGGSHFVGFSEKACLCFTCVCTFVSWCVWQWGCLGVSDYDAGVKSRGSGAYLPHSKAQHYDLLSV